MSMQNAAVAAVAAACRSVVMVLFVNFWLAQCTLHIVHRVSRCLVCNTLVPGYTGRIQFNYTFNANAHTHLKLKGQYQCTQNRDS